MARLLRVHFSSIGHSDARLSPLTLDFRHAGDRSKEGTAADTVLWLRNGGGKSSILNLFFSVFRPNAREFLGSSAEGRARRLEQYVKGRDLAFVVTEWDVQPGAQAGLFGAGPQHVRIVGQALAWKGQRSSAELQNLRRLFFSLLSRPSGLALEDLPVSGLGDPVPSFDEFRTWLREVSQQHAAAEVVSTEHQQAWGEHLESIGLDPELFKYQLRMNQREGAADEEFRFRDDDEFVRFLLDLAFDRATADQVTRNLQGHAGNLRERPRWELERRFVGAALPAVRDLAAAVADLDRSGAALQRAAIDVAAAVAALEQRRGQLAATRDAEREAAELALARHRVASNERDKKQRWIRGLERLALGFEAEDARRALAEADELLQATRAEVASGRAAERLRAVQRLQAGIAELREALARAEEALEPRRRVACARGSVLRALLSTERERVSSILGDHEKRLAGSREDERAARDEERRERDGAAAIGQEVARLEDRLAQRDRAREKLLDERLVDPRESAATALERWRGETDEHRSAIRLADTESVRLEESLHELRERRRTAAEERARLEERARELDARLEQALRWRDRLLDDARVREVEETDAVSLDAPRLVPRLRDRAEVARRRLLDSRVEGAEDGRSLAWLSDHGLLPSPVDVARVVEALRERGVTAHAGPEYLREVAPAAARPELLRTDPARHAGVIVPDDEGVAAAAVLDLAGLRSPVQVSRLDDLEPKGSPTSACVLLPDAALFDETAAEALHPRLQRAVEERREKERRLAEEESSFLETAAELQRFLEEHGAGRLDALQRESESVTGQRDAAASEAARLEGDQRAREKDLREVDAERERRRAGERRADAAAAAVARFVEEHEAHVAATRDRKQAALQEKAAAEERAEQAASRAARAREQGDALERRVIERQRDVALVADELAGVAHHDGSVQAPEGTLLDEARAAYDTARRRYEEELKDNRVQWEIEERERQLRPAHEAYRRAASGGDEWAIRRLAAREDLADEVARLERSAEEQRDEVAERKVLHDKARRAFEESAPGRRDVQDLPADRERPGDARSAREAMRTLEQEAEAHGREVVEAERARQEHERRGAHAHERLVACANLEKLLVGVAGAMGVELPPRPAGGLPGEPDALEGAIAALQERFRAAREEHARAEAAVHLRADAVRNVANRSEHDELRARYRERLKEPTDSLSRDSLELASALEERQDVIREALAKLDEDRRLIVDELLHLSDQVKRLLTLAERSSRLPSSMGAWGGRPYLRVAFSFPDLDEQRRALLEPLVDRLAEQARIPDGLELAFLTARELGGARGFRVSILKPDTVLRPDPIPLTLMSTFSRGQQLTAAILLYCTLVQLRARNRGRGRDAADGGVLILDNPIGTCSNAGLLALQRDIAAQMRVQLVYTTGVEDLEALATLPNTIRLRNTHRDRGTGDSHVTPDEADTGTLEGVRVVEAPRS